MDNKNSKQDDLAEYVLVVILIFFALGIVEIIFGISFFPVLENINWGISRTKVETKTIEKDNKGTIKTIESEQLVPGKTAWDFFELAGILAVPFLITGFGFWFQYKENKRAEKEDTRLREIAQDNLAEESIQAYLDNMAKLLLDEKLRKELFPEKSKLILGVLTEDKINKDNAVRDVARTQTITILRRLKSIKVNDKDFQKIIINFLRDSDLYQFIFKNTDLSDRDFSHFYLEELNFEKTNLSFTKLQYTLLKGANLQGANLQGAYLFKADLRGTNLKGANLQGAYLLKADLRGTNLKGANLQEANLKDAYLKGANLQEANLRDAVLVNENISIKQIKLACFWEEAIYKLEWNYEKGILVIKKPDNKNFIEKLKKDTTSNPTAKPDCSIWEETWI